MKITLKTPRRNTLNKRVLNEVLTLYHKQANGKFTEPFSVRAYAEWSRAGLERKYGVGTNYKGLIIIDGSASYTESEEAGGFQLCAGDKIVPFQTSQRIEEVLADKEKLYTVMEVTPYTMQGALLTVEVLCG